MRDVCVSNHFTFARRFFLSITYTFQGNNELCKAIIHTEESIKLETGEHHNDAEKKESRPFGSSHSYSKEKHTAGRFFHLTRDVFQNSASIPIQRIL